MQTIIRWTETAEAVDGIRPPINSLAYSPSGDYIVAACGVRVLVYSSSTGTILHSLKGHSDTVYCVDYSSDGKRFVSGGADNVVIIWSDKGEGILKYQHKQSIQAVAPNPVNSQIVSMSSVDFGIWSPEAPKVAKHALDAKGLCAAWTQDGQMLAVGLIDGTIMLMANGTEEKHRIRRKAPIWTLAFNPVRENGVDVLAVGSWDQKLSFYNLNGNPAGKERDLDFDPCSVSFMSDGEYMLVSGSDHNVSLYTRDGNKLITVAEADDWVWCARQRPKMKQICCGTNDGTISTIDINVTTVHCIFQDQYVYRDNMTNIIVHQLALDRKMVIPCNDYVRKLATYHDRVAAQFLERVVIFELFYDDDRVMRYHDIAQIRKRLDCSMMTITGDAVIVSKDKRLTMYDFQGNKRREWVMDSVVRYIKVAGGLEGREALLVGLMNGQTLNVFLDNPFPALLVKLNSPIRCIDINSTRSKLAVVDENSLMQVYDLENKNALLFSETNVTAVVWNTDYDDMIAYSTSTNTLNIKVSSLPAYSQTMRGFVVGFKANKLYNIHGTNMHVVNVPHSHALYRYIEAKEFDKAYKVASLGVTDGDWKMLGMHAMTDLQLEIARRAFTNIQEVKLVELLNALELRRRQQMQDAPSEDNDTMLLADILAFQGKYHEAARQFLKIGKENRAIDMFCDLKMWEDARKVCSDQSHLTDLIRQQARWAEDSQSYEEAASLYETCGDYANAIGMLGRSGQIEKLMKMCRSLPKSEVALITQCAVFFKEHQSIPYALEAYEKVDDNRSLIQLYVDLGDWRRAFAVLDKCPQFARLVYVPWANWLADNDKFEESLEAFRAAKWPQEAIRMLETLASNSVTCRKYRDAAFYYIHLAEEYGDFEDDQKPTDTQLAHRIKLSNECVRRADVYFAYSYIYSHTTQPFTVNDMKLFRISRHLCASVCEGAIPMSIGKAEILYTLARSANRMDMVRTARAVFEKLQTVILPIPLMEQVDVETLVIRSKEFTDREELLDTCYRCKQVVTLIAAPGDCCPNCFHPFVRSFANFENLPLVEFTLSNELHDEDAEKMIRSGIGGGAKSEEDAENGDAAAAAAPAAGEKPRETKTAMEWEAETGANVINFEEDNIDYQIDRQLVAMGRAKAAANKGGDPFFTQLQYVTRPGKPNGVYQPYVANAEMIKSFRRDEIFIVKPRYGALPVPNRYYRVMKTETPVSMTLCDGCQHFFISDDYERECTKGSGCPLCRYKPGRQVGRSLREVMLEIENSLDKQQ